MKILEVLTYYRPHISGLTIYVERLSKAFARQGHEVTVLTSQYSDDLPRDERLDGVHIHRVPVLFRVSKGVIMPTFGPTAWRWVKWADVVHLHLPQFDAPGVAFRGQLLNKPVVLTYHSDLRLPPGIFNRVLDLIIHGMNRIAGLLADAVVTYTYDFGSHSPYLTKYVNQKLVVIPPPVEIAPATEQDVQTFRDKHSLEGKRIIGISARIAAEKGIEVLLAALPEIWESHPDVHVLHANPDAIGEDAYATRLKPQLEKFKDRYHLLGPLHGSELTSFYKSLDCLVMCSLNNTETFGLVQIEAMLNGVPAVASNLPGVRQPVQMTGMGEVTPVGDHRALASAVSRVLNQDEFNRIPSNILQQAFSPDNSAHEYHLLFKNLKANQAMSKVTKDSPAYAALKKAREEQR